MLLKRSLGTMLCVLHHVLEGTALHLHEDIFDVLRRAQIWEELRKKLLLVFPPALALLLLRPEGRPRLLAWTLSSTLLSIGVSIFSAALFVSCQLETHKKKRDASSVATHPHLSRDVWKCCSHFSGRLGLQVTPQLPAARGWT